MLTPSRAVLPAALALAALIAQDSAPVPTHDVEITLTEGTPGMNAVASPDHQWIAIDLLGSIWVIPFDGGEAKKITPDTLEVWAPTWAPDSQRLAFEALGDDDARHIESINIDGKAITSLTDGPFDDLEPVWSHDGTRILFVSDRGGDVRSIWQVDADSHALRRVTPRESIHPAWSPHDEAIAFVSPAQLDPQHSVWQIITLDAGGERIVATDPRPVSPSWNTYSNEFAWQHPGQWLSRGEYLHAETGHILRTIGGGATRAVSFTATLKLKRADYIAAHRILEPSAPQPLKGIVSPAVSPDGSKVAFVALGDLWVLPIGGRPAKVTDDEAVESDPAWSPDGFKLAFVSGRSGTMQIWMHDLRAGIAVPLTKEDAGVSGAAWSPDGSRVAFLVDRTRVASVPVPGTVSSCRARDSSATDRLASPQLGLTPDLGRPTWASDSCTAAVGALLPATPRSTAGSNQLLLYSFDRGLFSADRLFAEHSTGNRRGSSPVWSPDGFKMAFISDGRLWSVPVDSGGQPTSTPTAVADDLPDSPSWQRDSEHIVYVTPSGLRRTTGTVPEAIDAGLGWAPSPPPAHVVVHAGQMFDGQTDLARGQTDITIENGVITRIEPHSEQGHTGTVVDASDDFVMPGFIDARVHLDPSFGESLGRIWLAYGVTSVRDVTLDPYSGIEQREAIDNGRRLGPRVFITGDPFDGSRVRQADGVSVASEAARSAALQKAIVLGVDSIVARGRLAAPLERRLVDDGHRNGLRASTDSVFAAMAFGFDELDLALPEPLHAIVDVIGKSGVIWAPEISANGGFTASFESDRSMLRDARLGLFPVRTVERYRKLGVTPPTLAEKQMEAQLENLLKPRREAIKAIVAAGGHLVAGTNAGATDGPGHDMLFGLSLHTELQQLVAAGLTPFQALQAATTTAADALGAGDAIGTIEVGKLADLVFLGGDPLRDIHNTRDVRRVMRGGRLYTPGMLGVLQEPPR